MPKHGRLRTLGRSVAALGAAATARAVKSFRSHRAKKTSGKGMKKLATKFRNKNKKGSRLMLKGTKDPYLGDELDKGISPSRLTVLVSKKVHPTVGKTRTLHDVRPANYTCPAGEQTLNRWYDFGNQSQWLTTSTNAAVAADGTNALSQLQYFGLNPNAQTTGNTFFPVQLMSSDKFVLSHIDQKMNIYNEQNTPVDLMIYWFKAKRDTQQSWLLESAFELSDESFSAAALAFPAPGAVTGGNVGGTPNFLPYVSPADAPVTKTSWKLIKQHRVLLGPNAQRVIDVRIIMNMLGDKRTMASNATAFVKGQVQCVIRVLGGIDMDITGGSKLPTYAQSSIATIINSKLHFRQVKASVDRAALDVAVTYVPANATAANQRIVNIVDVAAAIVQN